MNTQRPLFAILILVLIGILTSACSGRTVQASGWPGLTATDSTAYVSYNNHVYAIDLANGTEKWRYPQEADNNITFFAAPSISMEGNLIVGDYSSNLHVLDPESGIETVVGGKWPFEGAEDRYIAQPLATDEGIFAASSDGKLYALNYQGDLLWEPFETAEAQWAAPIADGERIYLPSLDHKIYAIDRVTGREVWSKDLEGALVGTPALNDSGTLYIGTFGSELVALNAETGDVLWKFPTNDWVWSGPALDDSRVYFGDLSGEFYAINQDSGALAWSYSADGPITGTPLITSEAIYFTTEAGSLISLNLSGADRWPKKTIDGKLYSAPIQIGDTILVSPVENDALLFAFNVDGEQVWDPFIPDN